MLLTAGYLLARCRSRLIGGFFLPSLVFLLTEMSASTAPMTPLPYLTTSRSEITQACVSLLYLLASGKKPRFHFRVSSNRTYTGMFRVPSRELQPRTAIVLSLDTTALYLPSPLSVRIFIARTSALSCKFRRRNSA